MPMLGVPLRHFILRPSFAVPRPNVFQTACCLLPLHLSHPSKLMRILFLGSQKKAASRRFLQHTTVTASALISV
jgi:hypothetical protein